ncbi:MAG: tetratricopeptide repeat protein [Chloroflexota bacterium]|nr:tetratricopeptide repeat protein [Chloroflexota bacterium]
MTKKAKRRPNRGNRRGWLVSPKQIKVWFRQAEQQLVEEDFRGVKITCRRILKYVPADSTVYGDAQSYLGIACAMSQDHAGAYSAFTAALAIFPERSDLWYNRGLASHFTMRMGQAVRDLERAVALETNSKMLAEYQKALQFSWDMARQEMAFRGPDFTLEELITQQELFQQGLQKMAGQKWTAAEDIFRQVIALGDVHPQPWGNLAGSLIMQGRFDEAETALRQALKMDPDYDMARQNLAILPQLRKSGPPRHFSIRSPFEEQEVSGSLMFWEED